MRREPDGRPVSARGATLLASLVVLPLVVMSALALLAQPGQGAREQPEEVERLASRSTEERPQRASAQRRTEHAVSRSRMDAAEPEPVELAKTVTLIVRGAATEVRTEAETVAGLLDEAGLETSDDDRVRPAPGEPLAAGATVVVEVVDVETRVDTEVLEHETVRRETSERERGQEVVVQEGQDGKVETSVERVLVDGYEESETVVGESVTEPVKRVIEVGTAAPPEPKPKRSASSESSGGGHWDRLAQCESNGNWSANTGNGYYGGLQFHSQTWTAHGGGEYASHAHKASREQQITVARRVQKSQGWKAWPHCSKVVGLR